MILKSLLWPFKEKIIGTKSSKLQSDVSTSGSLYALKHITRDWGVILRPSHLQTMSLCAFVKYPVTKHELCLS